MQIEIIVPLIVAFLASVLTVYSAWKWRGEKYLCEDCRFNNDEDCRKAERPAAYICLAYRKLKS